MMSFDSVLKALIIYTKLYHKPFSKEALIYGLPFENGIKENELFSIEEIKNLMSRASKRAGLKSTIIKKELSKISTLFLPMILLLKNKEACILEDISSDNKKVKIILPDMGESSQWVDIEKLQEQYSGFGFLIKREYDYGYQDHKTKFKS